MWKTRKFALSALLLLVAATGTAVADEWQETTSKSGRFQAAFPNQPVHFTRNVKTDQGPIAAHFVMAQSNGGRVAFGVTYSDYPVAHVRNAGAGTILEHVQGGVLRPFAGKLAHEKEIRHAGAPGREFRFTSTSGGQVTHGTWRVYLVGNRLYQLMVIGVGQQIDADSVDKFFASFRVLGPDGR